MASSGVFCGRRRPGRLPLACLGAALAVSAPTWAPLLPGQFTAFSAPAQGGLSRKQQRGNLHTRSNLPDALEVPLDEAPAEEPEKEPMPERRVPYTMNIVAQFPQHEHLHEKSNSRKFIEDKIVHSFQNFEDIIKHVDVTLQVSENFHRDKPTSHHKPKNVFNSDGEDELSIVVSPGPEADTGHKLLTPYIFKVAVTLSNGHIVHMANAEKHAQASLTEALDHMVDVVRKSLRDEKERDIVARKKAKRSALPDLGQSDDDLIAESIAEALELEEDVKTEQMYQKVEAALGLDA